MQSPYLSTDRLSLRAMVAGDAAFAVDWFPGAFPVNRAQAEGWLRDQHRSSPWDAPPQTWLTIVGLSEAIAVSTAGDGAILGGVRLSHPRGRTTDVQIRVAPAIDPVEADHLQAEVIRLLVPWARDELESMVVTVAIGSDQPASIAAAREQDMVPAVRLREHLARPGRRADLLWYQALNAARRIPAVLAATGELTLVPGGAEPPGNGRDGGDA